MPTTASVKVEHMKILPNAPVVAVLATFALGVLHPRAAADLADEFRNSKPGLEIRYRAEAVDQEGIERDALASTAKARLSWGSVPQEGLSFGVEVDYVVAIGNESYNSTENGNTEYPVVADPTGMELNQAFLRHKGENLTVTAGRQRIPHFEQRFLGAVAWRQNDVAHDAVRVQSQHGRFGIDYSYVANVNRIFGPRDGAQPADWKSNSHLLRGTWSFGSGHSLGAFAYLMDFENDNGPRNSNATYGIDYKGVIGPLSLIGAFARQSDWADNPVAYDAPYLSLEARLSRGPATLSVGYEHLGSDGGRGGFLFPLGTNHKYNGWTDKFLFTPDTGLRDLYATVGTKVGPLALTLAAHQFRSDHDGIDYGQEIGFTVSYPIRDKLTLLGKFARYDAEEHASDTTKAWLMLTYGI